MCTWFYADKATLSPIITKAQQLPLADTIRNTMSRFALCDSLHLVEGHLVDDRRDKVFLSESFFPGNNSLRVAPVFFVLWIEKQG